MPDNISPVEPEPQEPPPVAPIEPVAEEVVIEEVEPHETRETPIEQGYEAINHRIDGLENMILNAIKPKEQEKKEDAPQTEKPEPKPGSKRIKLFR